MKDCYCFYVSLFNFEFKILLVNVIDLVLKLWSSINMLKIDGGNSLIVKIKCDLLRV